MLCCSVLCFATLYPAALAISQAMTACRNQRESVRKFLAATAKGYEYAARHPEEAAALLCQTAADTPLDKEMVTESMHVLSQVSTKMLDPHTGEHVADLPYKGVLWLPSRWSAYAMLVQSGFNCCVCLQRARPLVCCIKHKIRSHSADAVICVC